MGNVSSTSGNTSYGNDSRWANAAAEREAGDNARAEARDHMRDAVDAVGDKHFGAMDRGICNNWDAHASAREHYGNANRIENDILQDASRDNCTIL